MALNMEYIRKIECLQESIPKRIYHKKGMVDFSGFFTYDRLSLEEASGRERKPIPEGTAWGRKWEYGWFFAEITVPEECVGKRLMFAANLGECVAYVNGRVVGAFDQRHSHIKLTDCAKKDDVFNIALEVYAGHLGPSDGNGLLVSAKNWITLVPEENIVEFPEDVTQKVVSRGSVGLVCEEAFQLLMDIDILYDLRNNLEEDSMRRAAIDKGLAKMCDAIDIELPLDEFIEDVKRGREILKPLFECKNSPTTPLFYAIGHSHLDLEWFWTKEETRRKSARTLGNQLQLIEEYPEYKYIQSQPWILETVKNEYPELYAEVKKAVADGKIIVEGGMWVEADTNIPSGESLVRQFLIGKKFIKDEFGTDSKLLWLPDIFGVSGALPQIMKGCGVKYFMNAKVTWLYNGGDELPYSTFVWKGIDGSEVLSHVIQEYATTVQPVKLFEKWHQNPEKEDIPVRLYPYGWGDGGGGATRVHLEGLKRMKDLEGVPKMVSEDPNKFYEYVEENCDVKRKFTGEMYYAAHRGTYTAQAMTKKLNRRAELALREAEMWSGFLGMSGTNEKLTPLWKEVLFNQFHDVIPGSSIARVYERAEEGYRNVIAEAEAVADSALNTAVSKKENTITMFNSLSWDRKAQIELPNGYAAVCDNDGNSTEAEMINGKAVVSVDVPACGSKSYSLSKGNAADAKKGAGLVLENNLIKVTFNENGEMISLVNKENNIEFLSKPSNVFRMYKDMPTFCDAWDIEEMYKNLEIKFDGAEVIPEYNSELMSSLIIKKKMNKSEIRQRVILRKDSARVDFETEVDWKETHKLLKVDFDTNIHTNELLSEMQFCYDSRPTHKNRAYDADRYEVCQHKWSALAEGKRGFAILNDCKYGIGAEESKLSLTLLKASAAPDFNADKGLQKFTYSVMPFVQSFSDSNVVKEAYELNCPVTVKEGFAEDKSYMSVCDNNIIIDTVKPAEDGSGDLIVRLYECTNSYTCCKLNLGFDVKRAYAADMLENNLNELEIKNNAIELAFNGFEVLTVRISK